MSLKIYDIICSQCNKGKFVQIEDKNICNNCNHELTEVEVESILSRVYSENMSKEIIKILKNDDGDIELEPNDDMSLGEVFESIVEAVSIVSELMLVNLNDIEARKRAKQIKEVLSVAVDESYLE